MNQKLPITRDQAIELLKSMPQSEADFNHYLESEAVMQSLAEKFGENKEYWGMLGLLHDVDWALTKENWSEHCMKAAEILSKSGFDNEFIKIVQSHGYGFEIIPALKDKKRTEKIEHALAAAETITGLVYSYALMRGRKISDMDSSGLKKKFKDKKFAANCNREIISECQQIGLTLDDFFDISIKAINNIKNQIGLI
jgi:putative nucleotidyltransferase with HDIG domain